MDILELKEKVDEPAISSSTVGQVIWHLFSVNKMDNLELKEKVDEPAISSSTTSSPFMNQYILKKNIQGTLVSGTQKGFF